MFKKSILLLVAILSLTLLADEKTGVKKGDDIVDFGMRKVDVQKGKLSGLIWLGDYVGTKDVKEQKKVLVLNFFANWCKPCIKELPVLQNLYSKYKDKGLMVLSVNFRRDSEKFTDTFKKSVEILKEKKIKYPVLFDRFTNRNQLAYLGDKAVLPCLIVIDGKGKIIEKFQGEKSHDLKKIENVIKKAIGE